jgi:hypothetical protein
MNWVDRMAHRDNLLRNNADRVWDFLCMAIQSSVKSYGLHYGNARAVVVEYSYQTNCAYVEFRPPEIGQWRAPHVAIIVQRERNTIEIIYQRTTLPSKKLQIDVLSDETVALTEDGKPLSDDDASRSILAPIFFPATAKSAIT